MPSIVNLETAGLRHSSRQSTPSTKAKEAGATREVTSLSQYNFLPISEVIVWLRLCQ